MSSLTRRLVVLTAAIGAIVAAGNRGVAFVGWPDTLGAFCHHATQIAVVRVEAVDEDKGVMTYRKVRDLKGTIADNVVRHTLPARTMGANQAKRFLNRDNVGKTAVLMQYHDVVETLVGDSWYRAFHDGNSWTGAWVDRPMHWTYGGSADRLAGILAEVLAGREAIVPSYEGATNQQFEARKPPAWMRVGLERKDWNPTRDRVATERK